MAFVHLHAHSYFSFYDGTASVEQLVEKAVKLGMPAVALTDIRRKDEKQRIWLTPRRLSARTPSDGE